MEYPDILYVDDVYSLNLDLDSFGAGQEIAVYELVKIQRVKVTLTKELIDIEPSAPEFYRINDLLDEEIKRRIP